MLKPLVSIGIPTYNRPKLLKNALVSASNQTYPNIEIIVSDNCTPGDEVDKLLKSFMDKDERIIFHKQKENIGGPRNFDFVLKEAKGEYFMWMADDDECEYDYIKHLMDIFQKYPETVLCGSDINIVDEHNNFIRNEYLKVLYPDRPWNKKHFFTYPISNVFFVIYGLFKKEVLLKLRNHKMSSYKDYVTNSEVPYLAKVALMGRIIAVPKLLKLYRSHSDSVYIRETKLLTPKEFSKLRYYTRKRLVESVCLASIPLREKISLLQTIYTSWKKGRKAFQNRFKHSRKSMFSRIKSIFISTLKIILNFTPAYVQLKTIGLVFHWLQTSKNEQLFIHLLNSLKNSSFSKDKTRKILALYRPELAIEATEYPSIINNGYRHIERTIDIIQSLNLNPNHSIIDVGGADGTVSIMLSKAFPNAKIYTFEPIQASFQQLSQNTSAYPNIQVNNLALGNKAQMLQMQIAERVTSSSLFNINNQIEDEYLSTNIKKKNEEEIEVQRLDDIFTDGQIFNLIKLDVQGYELEVLKGGVQILKRTKVVLIEMQNHEIYSEAPKYYDLDNFLRMQGFELYDIVPSIRREKKLYEWDGIYINQTIENPLYK